MSEYLHIEKHFLTQLNTLGWISINEAKSGTYGSGRQVHREAGGEMSNQFTESVAEVAPGDERGHPSPLVLQRIATLRAAIEAEPVEDGTSHPGERIIAETVAANEAEGFVSALLEVAPNSLQASMLRLLGRGPVQDASLRRRVIEAGLSSEDVQIRDAAVQAVESWEDADCIELLRQHEEPVKWLADYMQDVIANFTLFATDKIVAGFYETLEAAREH